MKAFSSFLITCGIAGILIHTNLAVPQSRILDGTPVDTLKRFPHYVTITRDVFGQKHYCGGSIISETWIITALHCVPTGNFTVHFLLKNITGTAKSFAITLDDTSVVPYPTDYDNIALIKLPVTLKFSEYLAPIKYNESKEDYEKKDNGFVVMPGFSPNQTEVLTYGMFQLISPPQCLARYGASYDEYLQICTVGWGNSNEMPCEGNEGGGLISGWPKQPRLIGIYTDPRQCLGGSLAVYVKLSAYVLWIDETVYNTETFA